MRTFIIMYDTLIFNYPKKIVVWIILALIHYPPHHQTGNQALRAELENVVKVGTNPTVIPAGRLTSVATPLTAQDLPVVLNVCGEDDWKTGSTSLFY